MYMLPSIFTKYRLFSLSSNFHSISPVAELKSSSGLVTMEEECSEFKLPPSKKPCLEDIEENENNGDKVECCDTEKDKKDVETAALPKAVGVPFTRIKRRKFAVLLSYNGKDYKGMQWNPGFPSIEQELLDAMCKAVAFPADMAGDLSKLKFQRCARTDKGVSAVRQVVSLKISSKSNILTELDDAPAQINAHLPPHIRVFAVRRVTKSFDARHACSGRMYEYLLPTYTLAPYHQTTRDYRVPDDKVAFLEQLLRRYEGTRNYHNFTSGKKYEEMSSKRYITSFRCGSKFVAGDTSKPDLAPLEFIPLRVRGQSFVLHQIRKMIGFVIAIVRGYLKEGDFEGAFLKEKVDIPRAPSLGLMLENVYFDFYNAKFANSGERDRLEWEELDDVINKFKREHIHRTIIETEIKEMPTMQWLHTLQIHDFHGTAQRIREAETSQLTCQDTSGAKNTSDNSSGNKSVNVEDDEVLVEGGLCKEERNLEVERTEGESCTAQSHLVEERKGVDTNSDSSVRSSASQCLDSEHTKLENEDSIR